MKPEIQTILDRMKAKTHPDDISRQMIDMCELLSILSEDHEKCTAKMETQTNQLILLTRWLCRLTVGILALTLILCLLSIKYA